MRLFIPEAPHVTRELLTAEEEIDLAARIKRGDKAACEQLALANQGLVIAIARDYTGRGLEVDDLIQEGSLGLVRASRDYDPAAYGNRFAVYASAWIRMTIVKALAANARAAAGASAAQECDRSEQPGAERCVADEEEAARVLAALSLLPPFEAWVVRERYGLPQLPRARYGWAPSHRGRRGRAAARQAVRTASPRTYAEIARDCGLSAGMVRLVELAALDKLTGFLAPSPSPSLLPVALAPCTAPSQTTSRSTGSRRRSASITS